MNKMELRVQSVQLDTSQDMIIEGYVNKVEHLSKNLGFGDYSFYEKIEKGAFKRALERAESIKLLYEHNSDKLLAGTKNGSLFLEEDDIGLRMKAKIVDTTLGKDTYKLIKSGLIDSMSFGFIVREDKWEEIDGDTIRTVKELDLFEVSIVENPAYAQSTVSARGYEIQNIKIPVIAKPTTIDMDLIKAKIKLYEL